MIESNMRTCRLVNCLFAVGVEGNNIRIQCTQLPKNLYTLYRYILWLGFNNYISNKLLLHAFEF